MQKDIYTQAASDAYIIETRQMVRRQQKMVNELMDELDEIKRNSMFAIVFSAISLAFTAFMGVTFLF